MPAALRAIVRQARQILDDTARLRGRAHKLPDPDIDRALRAIERSLTYLNQVLGGALVSATRETR